MKRLLQLMLIPLVAVLGATTLAAPAQAAPWTSSISFNASPEPLAAGGQVTLSGKAGYTKSGNAGIVRFYFRRTNATAFTYITWGRTSASGAFLVRTRQTTSGYWKAVYGGNAIRKPATSGADHVEAKAWRYVTAVRFRHTDTGDYTGPVVNWSTDRSATVTARVNCPAGSINNFFYVYWTGKPAWGTSSVELPFKGTVAAAGTRYLYPDEKTGYIEIATQDNCTWTVTITQRVRAYVAV
ncbi:hypothetical protein [Jidongwangia harbinensis]|uniref:hypothetical protein n=1 Tax=Jidongwangia harbinensis TaxID=2878561 RepID=UPI001CDA1346|nr:hypothetical protein [Jidongwangia harbinensis]MCA2212818.1 hypothetical protein [Jidongwangia harbinensis]